MLTVRVIVKQSFNLEDNKPSLPRQSCVQNVLYPLNVLSKPIFFKDSFYMFCQFLSNRLPRREYFLNCLMIPNTFLVQFRTFKSTESLIILRQSFGIDEETGTRENWCYIPDLNMKIDRREGPSPQDVSYFILVVWRCSLVRCLYGS